MQNVSELLFNISNKIGIYYTEIIGVLKRKYNINFNYSNFITYDFGLSIDNYRRAVNEKIKFYTKDELTYPDLETLTYLDLETLFKELINLYVITFIKIKNKFIDSDIQLMNNQTIKSIKNNIKQIFYSI